ncbi:MAG TPA: hypothetical protein VH061_03615 [Solirubrobacteraceae bacterium]|jgi:hypothetical protein|nr:hypothetical protein [Solirubrobacteraceae bacterium]
MRTRSRLVPILALFALAVSAMAFAVTGASAGTVKLTPVKGATYAGTLSSRLRISLKVDRKGKTATIALQAAPAFCAGSGTSPEPHSAKPATISKQGALSATITYMTGGIHPQKLAIVTVKGHFYTFGSATPVFQGTVKSTYVFGSGTECNGQESFQATKR